jgi:hypothetical protein
LMLLQCASFVAMFRQMTAATASDVDLGSLQPLPVDQAGAGRDALGAVFSDLTSGRRLQAARKCLGYLQAGGDPEQVIALARHHVVYGAEEAHDFKFAEAVFDTWSRFAESPWRSRFLSAGMAYFKAPARRPQAVVDEARELLSTR